MAHVHKKLWESALNNNAADAPMAGDAFSWLSSKVTTHIEWGELAEDATYDANEEDHRMYALFAALLFGGDLEV